MARKPHIQDKAGQPATAFTMLRRTAVSLLPNLLHNNRAIRSFLRQRRCNRQQLAISSLDGRKFLMLTRSEMGRADIIHRTSAKLPLTRPEKNAEHRSVRAHAHKPQVGVSTQGQTM